MKAKPKAKAKSRAKAKKASSEIKGKAATSARKTNNVNPAEVRQDVTNIVGGQAKKLTRKMLGEAVVKGQLATMKYLFEVAGVYPPATEGIIDRPEEDTLAQRLVRRLGLPEGPLPNEEDDDAPEQLVIPMAEDNGTSFAKAEKKVFGGVTEQEAVENGEVAAESEAGLGNALSD